MNLDNAKTTVMMLIDSYSQRGEEIDETDANVADYALKVPAYLDLAQKHIASIHPIKRMFDVSQNIPVSGCSKETYSHSDTDVIFEYSKGYAYHFEVDDYATVVIEGKNSEGWHEIDEVSAFGSENGGFERFKNVIDATGYTSIRLKFTGDSYYNIRNVCLFSVKYSGPDRIPNYAQYVMYSLPEDYSYLLSIKIKKSNDWVSFNDYYIEGTEMGVLSDTKGEIRLMYGAVPATIDDDTDEEYELELPPTLQGAACYYAAAMLLNGIRSDIAGTLLKLYQEKLLSYREDTQPKKRVKGW